MLKPGISAIEAGIRLAFLPYPSWEDFDQLHIDVSERMKNNQLNPRLVPNHITSPENINPKLKKGVNARFKNGDILKYDDKHDNGGVFIFNSMCEVYRNADLIIATYENQIKHSSNTDGRSTLCLNDPRTKLINRQTRFTVPSIEAWCIDQGYRLPPPMDHETLNIFLGHLSQDSDSQFNSAFDGDVLLGRLKQELADPKPTSQHSESYLTSYIYALNELKSIFGNVNIHGEDVLIKPQPFEVHKSQRTEVESTLKQLVDMLKQQYSHPETQEEKISLAQHLVEQEAKKLASKHNRAITLKEAVIAVSKLDHGLFQRNGNLWAMETILKETKKTW
jgi:hypothetical protein